MSKGLTELRAEFPVFKYVKAQAHLLETGLRLEWEFQAGQELVFRPFMMIAGVTQAQLDAIPSSTLAEYVFQIGLVEMLSYWKAFCSPRIQVEAGPLNQEQIEWWHHLLINGLGEFFFVNQIDFTAQDFVTITAQQTRPVAPKVPALDLNQPTNLADLKLLLPVGGGKDSALSLELLRHHLPQATALLLNPTQAARELVTTTQLEKVITIERHLDPLLLDLNHQGYLNGHTPFSALLAFTTTLAAKLFGLTHIAVSNERSSNEGNVLFHNHEVNHQYSKTFEFESRFQAYIRSYFPEFPHYFSFLRPLYELQIAKAFAKVTERNTQLLTRFRSCNRGQKANVWCGECPKCLFAYLILYPFLPHSTMLEIFGQDLYDQPALLEFALEQVGYAEKKPLECVGTHEESLCAFYLSREKILQEGRHLPVLLQAIHDQALSQEDNLAQRSQIILSSWNDQHSVPTILAKILHDTIHA
jgi:hypothetical protein